MDEKEMTIETIREFIHRYFLAIYGKNYAFRAPETFGNALERFMLAIAGGSTEMADENIKQIEAWASQHIWAHSDDTL